MHRHDRKFYGMCAGIFIVAIFAGFLFLKNHDRLSGRNLFSTNSTLSSPSSPTFSSGSQLAQVANTSGNGSPTVIFLTSGSTWNVPSDWNSSNNTIEAIGGGGGGTINSGGGGGAYAKAVNVSLTPGASVAVNIGAGGTPNASGGDTYFCNSMSNCGGLSGSAVVAGAQGGTAGGSGGSPASSIGATKYSGGNGGSTAGGGYGGSGGGGAAGPNGSGGNGGNVGGGTYAGGGGGGSGGGAAGGTPSNINFNGGAGGNNSGAGGGGTAGTDNGPSPFAGINGGGGGGGGYTQAGASGGNGVEWNGTYGAGGGGGGNGGEQSTQAGSGGDYGGGGGGGSNWGGSSIGGPGAPGIIVITYISTSGSGGSGGGSGGTDTTPPSTPTNLSATAASPSIINLSWSASTDNTGVAGYNIYRNNIKIGNSGATSYQDSGLQASTQYTYTVTAYDVAGNTSSQSTSATVSTQSPTQFSSNIYISQSGNGSGLSCSSPLSVNWFNTVSSWGSGASQIHGGDTVHLCGNITSGLNIQGSGTAGNPITILFDPGASMITPAWSGDIIDLDSNNYITIDGGATGQIGGYAGNPGLANGVIESTANGTNLANHVGATGIDGDQSQNIIIKNLVIEDLYVHAYNTTDDGGSVAVRAWWNGGPAGPSNWLVENCIFHDELVGFQIGYGPGSTNFTYTGSTAYNVNWGGNAGDDGSATSLTNLTVSNDWFHDWSIWDQVNDDDHHNGFYAWAEDNGSITGITYSGNVLGPNSESYATDDQTADLFISGEGVGTSNVYNNIFIDNGLTPSPSNGMIFVWPGPASVTQIYNNTFISKTNGADAIGVNGNHGGTEVVDTKNNICVGVTCIYGESVGSINLTSTNNIGYDSNTYNNIQPPDEAFGWSSNSVGNLLTLAQWQGYGYDLNMSTINPNLSSSYVPQSGSPAISSGTNLSSLCGSLTGLCSDISGTPRPSSGAWTIGAYQYGSGGSAPAPSPSTLPPTTPSISSLASSVTSTSATVTWNTSIPATTQVFYGLTTAYGSQSSLVSALATSHTVTLTNLTPNTIYHYGAVSGANSVSATSTGTFTTASNSVTAPSGVSTSGSGSSGSAPTEAASAGTVTPPVIQAPATVPAPAASVSIPSSLLALPPGSIGASVVSLQDSLITFGYLAPGLNTGYYGSLTAAAVAKYKAGVTLNTTVAVSSIPPFTRNLLLGSTGTDVKSLQVFLNSHGFTVATTGNGSLGHETTYYGPATYRAVIRFQDAYATEILKPYGLSQGTGYFGTATMKEANEIEGK